jgi:hypothetical protein
VHEHFTLEMLARICRQILAAKQAAGELCSPSSGCLKRYPLQQKNVAAAKSLRPQQTSALQP